MPPELSDRPSQTSPREQLNQSNGCLVETPPAAPLVKNMIREINIRQLDKGYVVQVGCHSFAIETPMHLVQKLTEYINEPAETEKKWFDGKLF